jgi:hypothetical protein
MIVLKMSAFASHFLSGWHARLQGCAVSLLVPDPLPVRRESPRDSLYRRVPPRIRRRPLGRLGFASESQVATVPNSPCASQ